MKNKKEKINRRGFIEQSAKITAAGIMLSRLPAKSKKLFSIEGEIKVALIYLSLLQLSACFFLCLEISWLPGSLCAQKQA